jgi:Tfp pilus tip-associated adhesin PilY1
LQANRTPKLAGTTFYMLNAGTGALLDSRDVGNDGLAETVDDCTTAAVNDCTKLKNALQTDPVATGPADSRFITKAYLGDVDGRVWRFDIGLNASLLPIFTTANAAKIYDDTTNHQPIFASMATVNVVGGQYIFFGTGSDLLPSSGVSQAYQLMGVLDDGVTGAVKFQPVPILLRVDGSGSDEKVSAFPAVAGDIVFFTTTTTTPATPCTPPIAKLYALTFLGGPAYDTSGDGQVTNTKDSTLVASISGARATAPFIVDSHLVFAAGGTVQVFGDQTAYNNGIGQAGVRILSWREVR